jgi:hypothetical protein
MLRLRLTTLFFIIAVGFVAFAPAGGATTSSPDTATVLAKLPPDQRQNVLVTDRSGAVSASQGAVTVNPSTAYVPTSTVDKPSDHPTPVAAAVHDAAWEFQHRFDTPAPNGETDLNIPGTPVRSQVSSPFDTRTGAFHGARSINGYSAERVSVSIPCGSSHFTLGQGVNAVTRKRGPIDQETGYVYIGGWGAGPNGAPVDAGLQKSSAQAAHDEYTFYFKYAKNKPITSNMRFACGGPDVVLELYPLTNSLLVFSATGALASGKVVTITIVQNTGRDDGWSPNGGSSTDGIILKRLISIAQPDAWNTDAQASFKRFTNGSYFGIASPANPKPTIAFKRCEIGRIRPFTILPTFKPWTAADTWVPHTAGIYVDWPPSSIIHATGACDVAGIYLKPQ